MMLQLSDSAVICSSDFVFCNFYVWLKLECALSSDLVHRHNLGFSGFNSRDLGVCSFEFQCFMYSVLDRNHILDLVIRGII